MKGAIVFLLMAALAAMSALVNHQSIVVCTIVSWLGVAFLMMSLAYFGNCPGLLGKQANGRRAWWSRWIFWPYDIFAAISFLIQNQIRRGNAATQISPGVWISRWLSRSEARKIGVEWIAELDLVAEFGRMPLPKAEYLSMPVLDWMAPSVVEIRSALKWVDAERKRGPVLVHCAMGHGRSAVVMVAWVMSQMGTKDIDAAIADVQKVRPRARLNPYQRRRLEEFVAEEGGRESSL